MSLSQRPRYSEMYETSMYFASRSGGGAATSLQLKSQRLKVGVLSTIPPAHSACCSHTPLYNQPPSSKTSRRQHLDGVSMTRKSRAEVGSIPFRIGCLRSFN